MERNEKEEVNVSVSMCRRLSLPHKITKHCLIISLKPCNVALYSLLPQVLAIPSEIQSKHTRVLVSSLLESD